MKINLLILIVICTLIPLPTQASEPVRIGLTLGLTGKYDEMSAMQMKGYRLWEKQVNDRGGLTGRAVKMTILDDKSDGATAAGLYEEMLANKHVDLIFGPYSSTITAAILPVADRYGYPVLVGGASSDKLWDQGFTNVFGVYTPASRYTVGFLEMLVASGVDRIAILAADDVFSQSVADGASKWASRYGLSVVSRETFTKGKQSPDEEIGRARSSGANVLIMCGHLQEALSGRRAMERAGWEPAAYYATVGPVMQGYQDQLGPMADGTFSSSQWEPNPDLAFPGSPQFLRDFSATYSLKPSYHAATAFASGIILERAVRRAGGIVRNEINEALSTLDTMSIIGRYGVDQTGMQIRQFPVIVQWQEGQKEIIWPEELKTAEPVLERAGHD